ncbi:MAG: hypothetical protein ACOC56_03150, partial [Atribacterota bacterium]
MNIVWEQYGEQHILKDVSIHHKDRWTLYLFYHYGSTDIVPLPKYKIISIDEKSYLDDETKTKLRAEVFSALDNLVKSMK